MNHYRSFEEAALQNAWATIGVFDGVHRGHQAILAPMIEAAHASGSPAVVVTFLPHPIVVLRNIREPIYLSTPDERARLLGALGIDAVITLTFNSELAAWSAEHFMTVMKQSIGLKQLWVGGDFALGRNRQGTLAVLEAIGRQLGYTLHVINEVTFNGSHSAPERISSSAIRGLVRQGAVAQAAQMLGRPYSIEGTVVHGDQRGRLLGFPTANIDYWTEKIVPAFGVYATWIWVGERRLPSVTSVGVRPTFDPPVLVPRVEAFIIDFEGDLYDQQARLEFVEFLRPELRFSSAQALIDQMTLDTQQAREVLAHVA